MSGFPLVHSKDLASPHHRFTTISLLWEICDKAHFGPLHPFVPLSPFWWLMQGPRWFLLGVDLNPYQPAPLGEDHSPEGHREQLSWWTGLSAVAFTPAPLPASGPGPREPPANANPHGFGTALRSEKRFIVVFFLWRSNGPFSYDNGKNIGLFASQELTRGHEKVKNCISAICYQELPCLCI